MGLHIAFCYDICKSMIRKVCSFVEILISCVSTFRCLAKASVFNVVIIAKKIVKYQGHISLLQVASFKLDIIQFYDLNESSITIFVAWKMGRSCEELWGFEKGTSIWQLRLPNLYFMHKLHSRNHVGKRYIKWNSVGKESVSRLKQFRAAISSSGKCDTIIIPFLHLTPPFVFWKCFHFNNTGATVVHFTAGSNVQRKQISLFFDTLCTWYPSVSFLKLTLWIRISSSIFL